MPMQMSVFKICDNGTETQKLQTAQKFDLTTTLFMCRLMSQPKMTQFHQFSKFPYLVPSNVDADLAEGGDAVAALGLGLGLVLPGRSLGLLAQPTCGR